MRHTKTHTLQSTSQNHYPQKVIIIIHKSRYTAWPKVCGHQTSNI
uniref:Uncharacterized protein n=1 Tax=Anguilla anguilla TaxID=7936 RepID=A0A0E9UN01_ANGAN